MILRAIFRTLATGALIFLGAAQVRAAPPAWTVQAPPNYTGTTTYAPGTTTFAPLVRGIPLPGPGEAVIMNQNAAPITFYVHGGGTEYNAVTIQPNSYQTITIPEPTAAYIYPTNDGIRVETRSTLQSGSTYRIVTDGDRWTLVPQATVIQFAPVTR